MTGGAECYHMFQQTVISCAVIAAVFKLVGIYLYLGIQMYLQ